MRSMMRWYWLVWVCGAGWGLTVLSTLHAQSNTAPTLAEILPRATLEDHPLLRVPIRLADAESPPEALRLEVVSGATPLLPAGHVWLEGTGAERYLSLNPAANSNGLAVVRLRVSDPEGAATEGTFQVTVVPVEDPPQIEAVAAQEVPPGQQGFRVPLSVRDPDTSSAALRYSVTSSHTNVIPNTALRVVREASPIYLSVNVPAAASGSTVITCEVSDANAADRTAFVLHVQPADLVPSTWSSTSQPTALLDLDANGWLDLYSAQLNEFTLMGPGLTVVRQLRLPANHRPLVWGDFDGDGDLDAIGTDAERILPQYLRTEWVEGASPAFLVITNLLPAGTTRCVGGLSADFDSDGDLDVLLWQTSSGLGSQRVFNLENLGSQGFRERPAELPPRIVPFAAGDPDGDGDNDLLVQVQTIGTREYPLMICSNDGAGRFGGSWRTLVALTSPASRAGWLDVNDDGHLDVWYAGSGANRTNEIVVLTQFAEGFVQTFRLPIDVISTNAPAAWGDFDADGQVDLVTAWRGPSVATSIYYQPVIHWNDGSGRFTRGHPFRSDSTQYMLTSLLAADLSGDGRLDVLANAYMSSVRLWTNNTPATLRTPGPPVQLEAYQLGQALLFSWSAPLESSLSRSWTYNLRVGTRPGAQDLMPAMALSDGRRLMPALGNAGHARHWTLLPSPLATDRVYWSVQVIDARWQGGSFAPEQRLVLSPPDNRPPEMTAPADVTMNEDEPMDLAFDVVDDFTPAGEVVVVAAAGDTGQLPLGPLSVVKPVDPGVDPGRRLVRLHPASDRWGVATVVLTAFDSTGTSATRLVRVTVLPVADQPPPELRFGRQGDQLVIGFDADRYSRWQTEISTNLVDWRPYGEPLEVQGSSQWTMPLPLEPGQGFFRFKQVYP